MTMVLRIFRARKKFSLFGLVLTVVFIIGFLLRIIGTNPGYPQTHPDEPIIYATAADMVVHARLDPFLSSTYKFQYPGFTIYLYAFLFAFLFFPAKVLFLLFTDPHTLFNSISETGFISHIVTGKSYLDAMYWGRYLTAILGFFSIPLVFLIGKKLFNKYVGMVAALFLAVNYRHVLSSHFSLVDGPNATLALLVLYVALQVYERPSRKKYILLGIAIALSLSAKLYFFSFFPLMIIYVLTVLRNVKKKGFLKSFLYADLFFCLTATLILFLVLNPYLFSHLDIAIRDQQRNSLRYGFFQPPFGLNIVPIWYLYEIGFGKIVSFLFLFGTLVMARNKKYWIKTVLIFSFILPAGAVLLYFSQGGAYVRNFASVVPFAIIIAAFGFWVIFEYIRKLMHINEKVYLAALILSALLVSFDQIKNSVKLDYYGSKPWNARCIQEWMDENIKAGNVVAINNLVPKSKIEAITYTDFDNTESYKNTFSMTHLQEEKVDYVVADIEYLRGRFNWWLSSTDRYWGIPADIFDNSFDGLVMKELSRHIVKTCIKPWESPANNYIAIKIPPQNPTAPLLLLQTYEFASQKDKVWELLNPFNDPVEEDVKVVKSRECKNEYCLKVEGRSGVPSREKIVIADFIPIEQEKRYVITGLVKANKELEGSTRDGFLRIDFYPNNNTDFSKRGMIASVSSRYMGDGSWKELSVSQVAPAGAKYLQVSFQVERYNVTFYVDDIKIFTTKEAPSKDEIDASNRREIDDNILYPISIL